MLAVTYTSTKTITKQVALILPVLLRIHAIWAIVALLVVPSPTRAILLLAVAAAAAVAATPTSVPTLLMISRQAVLPVLNNMQSKIVSSLFSFLYSSNSL
jgi:hypothetical protein